MASRNKRYEEKMRKKGNVKVTFWIPSHAEAEFKHMAGFCREHREFVPDMCRSIITGKLRRGV